MRFRFHHLLIAALLLACGAVFQGAGTARAQSGAPYGLTWSTVDAGSYTFSAGGSSTLVGTVGQPDAGLLKGGDVILGGGFWGGGTPPSPARHAVYLPLVIRAYSPP